MGYAFRGTCDSHLRAAGTTALAAYSGVSEACVDRYIVTSLRIDQDSLDGPQLARWVDGCDPTTEERRGRQLESPAADLVLDSTLNAPKSFSVASLLHPELAREFEALQDRLRDRILTAWQRELNARRGAGGRFRERLSRIEVVELRHRRSRALDPHIHRHLWLSVRVQGQDGRWSNVDSRVAMRMQNLVNAEGDLAARTDPEWLGALARYGYTISADGEIAELAHVVRPLSRRANQIEANRALQLARWRHSHMGQEPSPDVLRRIDRYAWAADRPDKPGELDEAGWTRLVQEELENLDPGLFHARDSLVLHTCDPDTVDRDLLARKAIRDADDRSKASSGRFSVIDVRAGATRAVAACGVSGSRTTLQHLIDDVTTRALTHARDLIPDELNKPQHVKSLVTETLADLKATMGSLFERLSSQAPWPPIDAGRDLDPESRLDPWQTAAVQAIVGGDRLVTVSGPAGTGKTTLLRAARAALVADGRRLLIVAPTRKAAAVAGREVEALATSVHSLLADHGWRWRKDDADADVWWRLHPGQCDPQTGFVFTGPLRLRLDATTRIVVDEAGMLDLNAAEALTQVALETGASIALIGDAYQAAPVGHAGALAMAARRAGRAVQLAEVHRFNDPDYAALTLRLRAPRSLDDALSVANSLERGHHVVRVDDAIAAQSVLVDEYFRRQGKSRMVAIVTATNHEAAELNEAIQDQRIARGQIGTERIAVGRDEQRILEGDVVQTRRNDRAVGVENRAIWEVAHIGRAALELRRMDDTSDLRVVSRDYAADFVHLAYATTVHGIQGETTDCSLVGPGVDAAGLYVGLTRGRRVNEVVVVASTDAGAKRMLAETMMRGIPEGDLDEGAQVARRELNRAARDPELESQNSGADASAEPREESVGSRGRAALRLLAQLAAWLVAARLALLRERAVIADDDARQHARATRQQTPRATLSPETRDRFEGRIAEYERLETRLLTDDMAASNDGVPRERIDHAMFSQMNLANEPIERGIAP